MSAIPPKADIRSLDGNVRFVPKADIEPYLPMSVTVALSGSC